MPQTVSVTTYYIASSLEIMEINRYIKTAEQSNGPAYSNTVIGTLAVDGWAVTFGTARRGRRGRSLPRPLDPRCTKCNSPPINGQCTNFVLFDVALELPFGFTVLNCCLSSIYIIRSAT